MFNLYTEFCLKLLKIERSDHLYQPWYNCKEFDHKPLKGERNDHMLHQPWYNCNEPFAKPWKEKHSDHLLHQPWYNCKEFDHNL